MNPKCTRNNAFPGAPKTSSTADKLAMMESLMTRAVSRGRLVHGKAIQMKQDTIPPRDEILQKALALDPSDRAYLADELERSLPTMLFPSDELSAAWSSEIDRRINAYDRGETNAVGFDTALDHARKALAEQRSRQGNS